jgi:pimeloyl-ACP methyl ester carboxylesterase
MNYFTLRPLPALGLLSLSTLLISGCLSGSGSSSNDGDSVQTGTFVDSPVEGLSFRTNSNEGQTDAEGSFTYRQGETVHFSLAGLELGSAPGAAILSPKDLITDAQDSSDPAAINMARLLQSLDADGNLSNGIQLQEELREGIDAYLADNPSFDLALDDPSSFETAVNSLLAHLNAQDVFSDGDRQLRDRLNAWLHMQDSLDAADGKEIDFSKRPVLFVHGGAGSASQFESQAQRFIANGYPRSHLATYEYNTSPPDFTKTTVELNAAIDALRQSTGFDKIHLMGHSMGTEVSRFYLSDADRAAKVAAYVNLDGRDAEAPFGGVPTLALWGQYVTLEIKGATNVYPPEGDPVAHIEVATSADSFARMYSFFNDGAEPATTSIPAAEGEHLWIAGRANLFPANTGAEGTVLEISEVDPATGRSLSDAPVHSQPITSNGHWGPFRINNGGSYEFVLRRPDVANADHYFYREAYTQDSYQIRLNTSVPGGGLGAYLARSPDHSNLSISRDMELWGDQGGSNDLLRINGTNVITEQTGPLLNRLSNIFIHDRNTDQVSNLAVADPVFSRFPFMSGLDLFLPGNAEPDDVIEIELTSRRGGEKQMVNVPNWSSDKVRSISVHFRDHND